MWLIVLLTLLPVGAVAFWISEQPAVYWASTKVLLQPPASADEKRLAPTTSALLSFAGLLEVKLNEGNALPRAASAEVNLVDRGIYDSSNVRVPNYGGQWANNFMDPVLIVEVSGPSEAAVRDRLDSTVAEVKAVADSWERFAGVAEPYRVDVIEYPSPVIERSEGHKTAAMAVAGLLGVVSGCALAVVANRVRERLARTRRAAP